jgi:hypothetical protein
MRAAEIAKARCVERETLLTISVVSTRTFFGGC